MLNVAQVLKDRRILFIGATGFVGKVALSLLLKSYPELGKVFVLVRPGAGSTSEQRFFQKIVRSPVFDPIREEHGDAAEAYLREKVVPLAGDAARPDLNFTPEDFARFGKLDAVINCAGLVSFAPALDTALRINTLGVRHVLEVARKTSAAVVHVSTCFVAGNRDGEIWEDEPVNGYFPRKGELTGDDFHVDKEIADCERIIAQVKELADDHAHLSMFRDRARQRLRDERRDPDEPRTLKLAVARERKLWVSARLTELGMERAKHWGWPNIYTYSKSLGDQVLAAAGDVNYTLVRPSIVETSVRYPFPGWNEGFTTSAPMAFLVLKGHRTFAAHSKARLDVVPVDMLAAGIVGATAATLSGTNKHVYQCATGDTVPLPVPRAVELTSLWARKYWRDREAGSKLINRLRSRLESVPSTKERYRAISAPAVKGVAESLIKLIDTATPSWGAPRIAGIASEAKQKLDEVAQLAGQVTDLFDLFMPFIYERHYVFRSDNVRELFAAMRPEDRELLKWDPETIEWRSYWLENHLPALKKWIFPDLENEFQAKPKSVYTYKDLLELFDATCKLHKSRLALRKLPLLGSDAPIERYTFRQVQEYATRGSAILREHGVGAGDKVLLMSENRPEWGISYFAILKAGCVVVPVDEKATLPEVVNILRSSRATAAVLSDAVRERMAELPARLNKERISLNFLDFDELYLTEPRCSPLAVEVPVKADDVASLIFTSGTTGTPKGVMLSHRNFTSLLSKLVSVFDLGAHDKLLSVLPLHHTFEFTAGFLMPFMRGAQVTYLSELSADSLNAAFEEGDVTGMIGVPALWQMLHRKIEKGVSEQGPWVEEVFRAAVEGARRIRDKTGVNVGKILFWPVQKKLGGRMRLMVSGGSALPADVMKTFRGLGFPLFEGYGLTEAAPVLAVQHPGTKVVPGSVGEPLPGIELSLHNTDGSGVGEVVARGPNIMLGYFENPEATSEVLRDGWLHTGDLGRFDDDKRLYIVGRKKDMILAANGENVYPDELEELYGDSSLIKELSIVGLPEDDGPGELVACLLVPDYEAGSSSGERSPRAALREKIQEHVKAVSAKLPHYKRIKVLHLWDHELPRTATRKVKRKLVVHELQKLSRAVKKASSLHDSARGKGDRTDEWLMDLVAQVCQKPRDRVHAEAKLEELGFDSLMYTELGVALEAHGVAVAEGENLQGLGTVADLARMVAARMSKASKAPSRLEKRNERVVREKERAQPRNGDDLHVPRPIVRLGREVLGFGQRMVYERMFETKVTGRACLPDRGPFIVAANHSSHLDMGLVKHALGDWGSHVVAVAAKDYFFEDRLKKMYFENFTNLIPMDRNGSLRESLRLASSVLKEGNVLLIFPEGTRSETGTMQEFKSSIGYLALANQVDVVPMYLEGTSAALPKGTSWPKNWNLAAHIGPLITQEKLRAATEGMPKSEQYREAARIVEMAVRKLGKLPPPPRRSQAAGQEQPRGGES
ncbi:MAG: AMP-binding protein [Deltaproteobacteria bacterium]|nr:AMP-binding protein [Deltaproteobacteria bacterium]